MGLKMRDLSVKTEMQTSLGLDDRATLTPCCSVHSPCLVSEANTENRKAKKKNTNQSINAILTHSSIELYHLDSG